MKLDWKTFLLYRFLKILPSKENLIYFCPLIA